MIALFGIRWPAASAGARRPASSRSPFNACGWGPGRARLRALGPETNGRLGVAARSAGAACQVVYLTVDKDVQARPHRIPPGNGTAPAFPMTEADVDAWRQQFQVPGRRRTPRGEIPAPPGGWPSWSQWQADTGPMHRQLILQPVGRDLLVGVARTRHGHHVIIVRCVTSEITRWSRVTA